MADINPPPANPPLPNTLFLRTDVTTWDQQASTFAKAFEQHQRLDFCALNAGIDDRDDIFDSISPTSPPKQPNLKTFDVNLVGTYYGLKLAAHYLSRPDPSGSKPQPGGKIAITSSSAGIYPLPPVPQYTATKHALVGLVRSVAPAAEKVNIRVNALCPALVATGLAPPGLMDSFTPAMVTPMSTMLRCFDAMADFDSVGQRDWVEKGRSGEVVEGNLEELIWHEPPVVPASSDYLDAKGLEEWARAYRERNRKFAGEE